MSRLQALADIVDRLRDPQGCPWDRGQTLSSMRPYLLEECYEVLDAIEAGEPHAIREELGDLLFVVTLLGRILADTHGPDHDIQAIAGQIAEKMVVRHPHVFAGQTNDAAQGSIAAWENRKNKVAGKGRLDGVPRSLPALLRAHRQSEKAASVGFEWDRLDQVLAKVDEELAELRTAIATGRHEQVGHELGDCFLALADVGRHLGHPPEATVRAANDRFRDRFSHMEQAAAANGDSLQALSAPELEALWEQAKRALEAPCS